MGNQKTGLSRWTAVRLKFKVTLPEDSRVVISLDWEVKLIIPKGLSLSRIVIVERLLAEILGDEAKK